MKYLIYFLTFTFLALFCNGQTFKKTEQKRIIDHANNGDTLVLKNQMLYIEPNETDYFVVVNNDTSNFIITFRKDINSQKFTIDARYHSLYRKGKLYKTKIIELEKVLKNASNDFNLDSLSTLVLGQLVITGDLAIEVTNEFIIRYGNDFKTTDFDKVPDFLMDSKLTKDINKLFKPYDLQVDQIRIEKLGFIPSENVYLLSIIETKQNEIPEKIIDCMIWIEFKTITTTHNNTYRQ